MSRILRYQISDWTQITECLSNNSRNLYLSLSKHLDGNKLRSLVLNVNHTKYGILFAAMIKGTGSLITDVDEAGYEIPFLTTEEILRQLMKFGFYIVYDVKSNLPNNILSFLATIDNLGFDKISKVVIKRRDKLTGSRTNKVATVVFKTVPENEDLLVFSAEITEEKFNKKLQSNIVMNVSEEKDMQWDWLTYMANISDILDENIDHTNDFEAYTGVQEFDNISYNDSPRASSYYPAHPNEQGFYSHEAEPIEEDS